ncbi:MAG: hypothetical protein HQ517_17630, partial [SAR324 cluster bacterium]|nr:hypothetical protein [SAR324 cluster bacterium]
MFLLLFLTISSVLPASGKNPDKRSNYFNISLSASSVEQGQTLTVFVDSANRLRKIEISFLDRTQPMYLTWQKDHEHLFRAFLGVPAGTKPGKYQVVARATDINQQALSIYAVLQVRDAHYK